MRLSPFAGAYVPVQTVLHRMHPGFKVLLLVIYSVVIAVRPTPKSLLGLELFLIAVGWSIQQRVSYVGLALPTCILLAAAVLGWPYDNSVWYLLLGLGRVVCLLLLVNLFGMVTKATELWPMGGARWMQNVAMIFSLTVAMLPGIQHDAQRALDTETLRRGKSVGLLNPAIWLRLTPRLILRGLARADRLADAAMDRGIAPGHLHTQLNRTSVGITDLAMVAVGAFPAIAIFLNP